MAEILKPLEPMERVALEATFRQLGRMYERLAAKFGGMGSRAESAAQIERAREELGLITTLRESLPEDWR